MAGMEKAAQTLLQHWPAAAAGLAGLYCLYRLLCFVRADADLRLLGRREPPADAFEDQVVWVTGASQGLGEQLALQLAARGAFLILSARSAERLEAVKAQCRGKHAPGGVVVLPLDVTGPPEALQAAAQRADEAFGERGIHLLIHNAGASQRGAVEETAPEVANALLDLNVRGVLCLTRAALPLLLARASRERPRRITVIASMAGHMPAAGQAVYAACKASVAAYFRTLHSELWDRGVRVTLCHPGPIATGAGGQVRSLFGASGRLTEAGGGNGGKGRQSPERVAALVLRASWHGLDSCWIARHPVLLLAYLVQYVPALGHWVLNKVGPARAASLRSGGSGYGVNLLARGGGGKKGS